ncbi:MAG: HD domain-containing protein, partial [Gammaproteobacteria bacterium]
ATQLSQDAVVRFAALCHDLGKGVTPCNILPSHHGHEERGVEIIRNLCRRLRIPNEFRDLAVISSRFHLHIHRAHELKPQTVLQVLEQADALRKPKRFEDFLLVCTADIRGRKGQEQINYPQADFFRRAADAIRTIDITDLKAQQLDGKAMQEAIYNRRLEIVKTLKENNLK